MKKYCYAALILTAVLLLCGCKSKNEVVVSDMPEEAEHTLLFFGNKYEPSNVEVIEDILTSYMEEHPDTAVSYESLKGSDYYDALTNREASENLDDIFMVNHDTVLAFSEHGSLADLSEIASQVPFSESILSQMKSDDGRIYWLPTTVSAFGLYCNLDLLEKHNQTVPENRKDWEAICDYFVSKEITPIVANNDISLKTAAIARGFYPLYEQNRQAEAFEKIDSGKEKLSDYLLEGFALMDDFCKKGYIDAAKALETEKTSDDLAEFAKGESPFMLTGVWAAGRVREMAPELSFCVVPYPVLEDGSVLVINPDVRLSVSAKSDQQTSAKDFAAYFLEEDNIGRFADNQCSFSPLQDNFQPSLDEIKPIVESYRTFTPVIGSDSRIGFPIWDITSDAAKSLLGGTDLDTVMAEMDEQVILRSH